MSFISQKGFISFKEWGKRKLLKGKNTDPRTSKICFMGQFCFTEISRFDLIRYISILLRSTLPLASLSFPSACLVSLHFNGASVRVSWELHFACFISHGAPLRTLCCEARLPPTYYIKLLIEHDRSEYFTLSVHSSALWLFNVFSVVSSFFTLMQWKELFEGLPLRIQIDVSLFADPRRGVGTLTDATGAGDLT